MRCLAHIINLTTKEILKYVKAGEASEGITILEDNSDENGSVIPKLRKLVVKINSSPQRRERFLKHLSIFPEIKSLNLILDVSTRWNSTYLMLRRALLLREVNIKIYNYI